MRAQQKEIRNCPFANATVDDSGQENSKLPVQKCGGQRGRRYVSKPSIATKNNDELGVINRLRAACLGAPIGFAILVRRVPIGVAR